jgi:hypothetical protein
MQRVQQPNCQSFVSPYQTAALPNKKERSPAGQPLQSINILILVSKG